MPHFEAAVKADPNDADSSALIGDIYRQKREFERAVTYVQQALKLVPNSSNFHHDLGLIFVDLRDWGKASRSFAEAVRLDAKNYDAWVQLAQARMFENRNAESVEAYRRALALVADDWQVHCGLASVYVRIGEIDAAVAECRQAVRIAPDQVGAKTTLALMVTETAAGLGEARSLVEAAERLDANSDEIHLAKGAVLARQGKAKEAEPELRSAIAADPMASLAHDLLLDVVEPSARESVCRAWIAALPTDPLAHARLGRLLGAEKKRGEAQAEIDRSLALDPRCAAALDARARLHFEFGEIAAARDVLAKALTMASPPRVRLRCLLDAGAVSESMRDRSLARKRYLEAAKLFPDNSEVRAALDRTAGW